MTATTPSKTPGEAPGVAGFVERHRQLASGLPGAGTAWLDRLRAEGLDRFARLGFPTPRAEAWKYTNLKDLARLDFAPAADKAFVSVDLLPTVMPAGQPSDRLVFVDGRLRPDLSSVGGLPEGAIVDGLAGRFDEDVVERNLGRVQDAEGGPLHALNTAFMADGLLLVVPAGVRLERPVEVVFVSIGADRPTAHHPRSLVLVGRGSEATLVEHHVGLGSGACLSNPVTEIVVEDGGRLHHYKAQAEAREAFHVSTVLARLGRDVSYDNFVLTMGGRLSRNEIRPLLSGPGTECRLSGAYMVSGTQHADTTTVIDHAVPHCTSREVYKGVIDDAAHAVFQGKIIVRPDAQKTDGYQLNRALLLSDNAEIDSKPELEIYADDVKCSHGATAGELDDDQLFYLRARGIDETAARNLLVEAFLLEAVEEVRDETVRAAFQTRVRDWLEAGRPAV